MTLPRLLPAYATDHPVLELGTAETLVVATVCLWAAPHRDPWQSHPDWHGGFRAAGVAIDGEHAFDTLFWIVLAGGGTGASTSAVPAARGWAPTRAGCCRSSVMVNSDGSSSWN